MGNGRFTLNLDFEMKAFEQPVYSRRITQKLTQKDGLSPHNLNRVVVMLVAQDRKLARFSPSALAGTAVGHGYSKMAEIAYKKLIILYDLLQKVSQAL